MKTIDMLREIAEPLGILPALFTVDYRDKNNNFYHKELTTIAPPTVTITDFYREITREAIAMLEGKGYIVYSIDEILDGLSYDEFQALGDKDEAEARKHIRSVYRDFRKEQQGAKYPSVRM